MNCSYNLPSFKVGFSGLYSSKPGVINQSCQLDDSKQRQAFQGMSGQTQDSPFPVYISQSDIHQNEAGNFRSLDEYDIVSLTDFDPENAFGTDIHEIPKSVLDKYVPWNSDDQLTHLPAVPFNRHALPPVTLVNPINLNQTTSDQQTPPVEDITDTLPVESRMERRQDPERRKLDNQRQRQRKQDPEKRKLLNQRQRERYRERMKDPEKRKRINQRQRERRQDPEKRKLDNQRQRERMQDPEKRKLKNQRAMERYREMMADPEKRKLINQHRKERRQDPERRTLISQRNGSEGKTPKKNLNIIMRM